VGVDVHSTKPTGALDRQQRFCVGAARDDRVIPGAANNGLETARPSAGSQLAPDPPGNAPSRFPDCQVSFHRLGPFHVSLEAKRSRHVAVAIPKLRVSDRIAVSPCQ
jgi:hypothetical protein